MTKKEDGWRIGTAWVSTSDERREAVAEPTELGAQSFGSDGCVWLCGGGSVKMHQNCPHIIYIQIERCAACSLSIKIDKD